MRFRVQTLNGISPKGLERLPRDRYEVAAAIARPDAILVRSADMHSLEIPGSVLAVGRAGAGTNNIPVPLLSQRLQRRHGAEHLPGGVSQAAGTSTGISGPSCAPWSSASWSPDQNLPGSYQLPGRSLSSSPI